MKKTRLICVLCALTAAAWSLPGLAQAKRSPAPVTQSNVASMFDGGCLFGGGSAFDGH